MVMESNINCDAAKCLHNKQGKCDAAIIHVRNSEKTTLGDAHCNSYAYPIHNAGAKLLLEMGEDMTVDRTVKSADVRIACGVCNCKYNDDYSCTAKALKIADPDNVPLHNCACRTYSPT